MPKRTDIKTILIIGAGPIVIGQACEFDYSGAQACKALKDEGYRVVLVNSNPATIMTDPAMADATYIEPVEWRTVARIIERERPDALLPTMGGQTALNCALDLVREGVLEKFGVELIGAKKESIDMAEDRELFDRAMKRIGLDTPRSAIAHSIEEAVQLPVNADFEGGFAIEPAEVATNVVLAAQAGVAGISIEDSTGDPTQPLFDFALAVDRVRASRRALDRAAPKIILTARTEGFIVGRPDLAETVKRLRAFADAGADCLYAPGIRTPEEIAAVVAAAAPKPVNVLVGSDFIAVADLAALGMRRISVGGALARAAPFPQVNGLFNHR